MEWLYRTDNFRCSARAFTRHGNCTVLADRAVYKITDLEKNSLFKKFFVLYNVALPFMVVMMLIRGIVQVLAIDLGKMGNGMLSGFAGLSHITMMVSLLMLLIALKKEMVKG